MRYNRGPIAAVIPMDDSIDDPVSDTVKKERDDARCDLAVQMVQDVLWRFDESAEGTLTAYDVLGYVVEDLIGAGWCAACINESVVEAYQRAGADPTRHRPDEGAPFGEDDVFH